MTKHQDQDEYIIGRKAVLDFLLRDPDRVDTVYMVKDSVSIDINQILDACGKAGVKHTHVPTHFLDKVYKGRHQGVAARLAAMPYVQEGHLWATAHEAPLPLVVALDQVQDPGNVGAMARTLYALGGAGLVVARHGAARMGPAAMKSSMGALARLPVARATNLAHSLDDAELAGLTVYCAAGGGGPRTNAFSLDPSFPAVLVLGNEDKGIRPGVAKRCHHRVSIPHARDFDSLNVSHAGSLLVGLFARALWAADAGERS